MAHDRAMVHVVAPTSGAIKSDNGPAKPAKTGAHRKLRKDESNHDCPDRRADHDRGNGPRPCDVCLSGPHVVPSENNDGSHADVTVCNPNYDDVATVCLSAAASLSIPNRNCGVGPSEPSRMITPKFEQ
ncbi:hypothetical protein ACFX1X_009021 [Malus domestica]